jgi:hypothetical protein
MQPAVGPAYAMSRVFCLPVVLLGLLGRQRVAVSVSRDRTDAMRWRFQFGQRAILHLSEDGAWSWHTVTRNTRLEVEPLILEAEAVVAAAPDWIAALGAAEAEGPDWTALAAARRWDEGPSLSCGRALNPLPAQAEPKVRTRQRFGR